ncbi:hypothetical protein M413DRAFT_389455 [Hebeloma cylindrosporum]|uniref:Uncharacterized protein n=1 Tax=Hebeloma cylindrosporum TaxID=76867 RepID=A0A0C2Y1U8_HEBCY|nr:hypothetical protein M413DRAFT_389455 [Hebeloma cylindrosporum h7]
MEHGLVFVSLQVITFSNSLLISKGTKWVGFPFVILRCGFKASLRKIRKTPRAYGPRSGLETLPFKKLFLPWKADDPWAISNSAVPGILGLDQDETGVAKDLLHDPGFREMMLRECMRHCLRNEIVIVYNDKRNVEHRKQSDFGGREPEGVYNKSGVVI